MILVDDEEAVIGIGTEMLNELGLNVLTASNGREALAVFKQNMEAICCVILDLTMLILDLTMPIHDLTMLIFDLTRLILDLTRLILDQTYPFN